MCILYINRKSAKVDEVEKVIKLMVPLGIKARASRVLSERDNHYTTEPVLSKGKLIRF